MWIVFILVVVVAMAYTIARDKTHGDGMYGGF
jgi:hypothetical protein